jgi:anti-anti-sigma factor
VLRLAGELDLATADELREHVRRQVDAASAPKCLVIDLAGLDFVDVTGLGALLEARRKVVPRGGTLVLRRPRPMVLRMIELLDLDGAFELES